MLVKTKKYAPLEQIHRENFLPYVLFHQKSVCTIRQENALATTACSNNFLHKPPPTLKQQHRSRTNRHRPTNNNIDRNFVLIARKTRYILFPWKRTKDALWLLTPGFHVPIQHAHSISVWWFARTIFGLDGGIAIESGMENVLQIIWFLLMQYTHLFIRKIT